MMKRLSKWFWLLVLLWPACEPVLLPAKEVREVYAFTARWCGPCRANEPRLRALEARGVKLIRFDADSQSKKVASFGITRFPTYIVMVNGHEQKRTSDISVLEKIAR